MTGTSFQYQRDGNTATLTAPIPDGDLNYVRNPWRYELVLRK